MIRTIIDNVHGFVNSITGNDLNNSLNGLSLGEQEYNPGTVLKEKNNDTEYVFLGYDNTRDNLICTTTSGNMLNNNIYIINKNNIAKIVKLNTLQVNTRYIFE